MRCLEELEQELDTFSVREAQESKGEGERWASSGRRRELKPEPVFYAGLQVRCSLKRIKRLIPEL